MSGKEGGGLSGMWISARGGWREKGILREERRKEGEEQDRPGILGGWWRCWLRWPGLSGSPAGGREERRDLHTSSETDSQVHLEIAIWAPLIPPHFGCFHRFSFHSFSSQAVRGPLD